MAKSPQQKYLEKEIERVSCACGCGGEVIRRRGHYFKSYLKRTNGKLPRFLLGHTGIPRAAIKRSAELARGKIGPAARNWRGGRIEQMGYVYIWQPSGYEAEHRLVMQKMLGRDLSPHEVVHHKDGNRKNNSPVNLKLMDRARHALAHLLPKDSKGRFRKRD